ncbi:acyltransferase [Priestia aryabhattai]|uniref:acyltransferase n=2 Tax=Priestia aryabhattai TaxID=412384 RepID=UPI0015F6E0A4|nr:acyltransferase [Priestia aryabhattai]
MNFKILKELSVIKTLRFNWRYFKWNGLKLPVFVSKNFLLKAIEGNVEISEYKPGLIKLGFGSVGIFDKRYDKGIWENFGSVIFEGRSDIGLGSKVSVASKGKVYFGDRLSITAKSEIVCNKEIIFGNNVLISWDCLFMDTDWHDIYDRSGNITNSDEKIIIGDHVWIGCRSTVLKGVMIPANNVVAANSTLSKEFKVTNSIIGGVNKVLKDNIHWGTFSK